MTPVVSWYLDRLVRGDLQPPPEGVGEKGGGSACIWPVSFCVFCVGEQRATECGRGEQIPLYGRKLWELYDKKFNACVQLIIRRLLLTVSVRDPPPPYSVRPMTAQCRGVY